MAYNKVDHVSREGKCKEYDPILKNWEKTLYAYKRIIYNHLLF